MYLMNTSQWLKTIDSGIQEDVDHSGNKLYKHETFLKVYPWAQLEHWLAIAAVEVYRCLIHTNSSMLQLASCYLNRVL